MLLFEHLLNLDLRFHLMRKTGEISKICDRGTDAMQANFSIHPQSPPTVPMEHPSPSASTISRVLLAEISYLPSNPDVRSA